MNARFDYFVVFAEMRTGSNFLEANLGELPGLRMWGEAFNPQFMGQAGRDRMAGMTLAEREEDPLRLLSEMRARSEGMAGFRFFSEHDPRIMAHCLSDTRCGKVVLTRNPLDSFVSLQIARQTGQWRLGDMKQARRATVRFDPAPFTRHLERIADFQSRLTRALQTSGQTAFRLDYDDIQDVEVLNGIARFLGLDGRLSQLSDKTKVQNPAPLRDKVENYDEMAEMLRDLDPFALDRIPNYEPARGPAVRSYIAAGAAPLLYMPVPGGPEGRVERWLAELGGAPVRGMTQKDLRRWKRENAGHRTFTVLRHPTDRIHDVFCRRILTPGPDAFGVLRETLRTQYSVPIPEEGPGLEYDAAAHRAAFLGFLRFLKGNLGGQTGVKVQPDWATQTALVQGMAQFMLPDAILRETELAEELPALADRIGIKAPPLPPVAPVEPFTLDDIHDAEVEAAVRDVYQRDFMMFGFGARR
ncbi:nodulation protein NodH [Tranquillimonas alkanivorans]|uniref:LPS sulfotransferase NodH n=1 Tax=Tranquillimonas alkanivorans TaxID=441119 RepID=A0A1I5LA32_9RHOB|nr:nodulation protein NodH [Tranquillimonas alkanivorans]SFO94022.1 hypothetical protein SAMN04488047_101542 [Tranquillimonas alkanivorans]